MAVFGALAGIVGAWAWNGVRMAFVGGSEGLSWWFGREVSRLPFLLAKMAVLGIGVTIGVTERGYIFGRKGLQNAVFTLPMERGCKYGFSWFGI